MCYVWNRKHDKHDGRALYPGLIILSSKEALVKLIYTNGQEFGTVLGPM